MQLFALRSHAFDYVVSTYFVIGIERDIFYKQEVLNFSIPIASVTLYYWLIWSIRCLKGKCISDGAFNNVKLSLIAF